jgi:hypothetical protein
MRAVMRCAILTQISVITTDATNSAKEGKETIVLKTLGMQCNGKRAVKP